MADSRPNPDELLARVAQEESRARRGRLKLFFGYAAGVGKTYAMLQAARALNAEGRDVVVGYVEPHARPETQALVEGLECLPTLDIPYRGAVLRELNLDAALARHPDVLLVDELAHTNAPGMRHTKRWQDVEELLDAGIDAYSTVNVQHVESLNDVVAQISGVTVRETIPDEVFQRAAEVAIVDLPPDELLERLRQGKVYVSAQAAQALERFFRKENLVALREIALRETANRVHEEVESARLSRAAKAPWATSERLLVCVGSSPTSAKVIRAAKRLADRLDAEWLAVHVESARAAEMSPIDRERLHQNLRLAESLGAENVHITGDDVVGDLLDYANSRNVTKIVVGKTDAPHRQFFHRPSLVDRLIRHSGNVDVFVVRGLAEPLHVAAPLTASTWSLRPWIGTAVALAVATAVAFGFDALGYSEANLIMAYLLAVVFVGSQYGAWPSVAASVLAVFLFDVFFTVPYYRFTVHDPQYLITFAVMLIVGLFASTMMARRRYQAEVARRNERRTEALYRLSRRLTTISDRHQLIDEAERMVSEVFDAHAVIFLPDADRKIRPILDHPAMFAASASEFAAAQWVLDHNEPAGIGTNTLPSAQSLYLPMATPNGVVGVMAVQPDQPDQKFFPSDVRQLLETYTTQIAFALERDQLAEQSRLAAVEIETEKLRSSLLSAVSHDLRTPLAGIAGAASSLAEASDSLPVLTRQELLDTICDESKRLSLLVENLLHMTRLSSGTIQVDRHWQPVEEVIGSALNRMDRPLEGRHVEVELDDNLPLGHFDEVIIEQVLVNLLDNAVKYSAPGTPILITAERENNGVALAVSDRGRGLAPGDEEHVFAMFYRGADARPDRRGTGLGLAICQAVVHAHGGTIRAENRLGGGTTVRFVIPHAGTPPVIELAGESAAVDGTDGSHNS
jgi:two-component system sensor histidine kinase KdpD